MSEMSNSAMFLATTLDGHKKIIELFSKMTSSQIKDAVNIGISTLGLMDSGIQYKTLYNTINDLFGSMVSAVTSAEYCVDKKYMKYVVTIILSHAYCLFEPLNMYEHWPKTAVSEYLNYFEKLIAIYS